MLYAQPRCPPAEGAVKGVGDVQHNLHLKAKLTCMLSLTARLLSGSTKAFQLMMR